MIWSIIYRAQNGSGTILGMRKKHVNKRRLWAVVQLELKRQSNLRRDPQRSRFSGTAEPALSEVEGISRSAGPMREPNCNTTTLWAAPQFEIG
jgi:hypothetical protein